MFYNNRLWLIAAGAALIINSILLAVVMVALRAQGYTSHFAPTFSHVRLVVMPPEKQPARVPTIGRSKLTLKPALPKPVPVKIKSPRIKLKPLKLLPRPPIILLKPRKVKLRPPRIHRRPPVPVRRRTPLPEPSVERKATPLPPGRKRAKQIGGGGAATGGGGGAPPGGGQPAGGGSSEIRPAATMTALVNAVPEPAPLWDPSHATEQMPRRPDAPPTPPGVGEGPPVPPPGGGSIPPGGAPVKVAPTASDGTTSGKGGTPGNGAGDGKGPASGSGAGTTGSGTGTSAGTTAGNSAGSTAGSTSGATGGSNAGSTAGSTAGGTGGNTAGSTGGATAGSTAGDGVGAGSGGPFGIGAGGGGEGPRHIVYLLDMSPSMESRIGRAKQELLDALHTLQEGESFEIIAFSADNRRFSRDGKTHRLHSNDLVPATPDNLRGAIEWMSGLPLWGGTNLWQALKGALEMHGVNVLVLITDGVPTVGETDFNRLARRVREANRKVQARIYTVGLVGADIPAPARPIPTRTAGPKATDANVPSPPDNPGIVAPPSSAPHGTNPVPAGIPGHGSQPAPAATPGVPPPPLDSSHPPAKPPDANVRGGKMDHTDLPDAPPEPDHTFEAETLLRQLARESGGEYKQVVLGVNTPEPVK